MFILNPKVVLSVQDIWLLLQVWRRGLQRAELGLEGCYRRPPPLLLHPLYSGAKTNLPASPPPPLWPLWPGSSTSSGTGRSTNETQRRKTWYFSSETWRFLWHIAEETLLRESVPGGWAQPLCSAECQWII